MSGVAPATVAVPRFEPALMRRKLTGTLFYGACVGAIALLLLALVALLVDAFARAAPWLDVQFLTGAPSSRPERAGVLPSIVGTLEVGRHRRTHHVPDRGRRGRLPRRVRLRHRD